MSAPPPTVLRVRTLEPSSRCSSIPSAPHFSQAMWPLGSSLASTGVLDGERIHQTGTPLLSKNATNSRDTPGGTLNRLGVTTYHSACVGPLRVAVNSGKSDGRQRMKYIFVRPCDLTAVVKL